MVSQQTIDIIIRAEDRATAALEKVESQLSKVRNLALGLNNSFNTASNSANRLGTNLNKVNPAGLRRVNEISLQLQAALLIVARNIRAVQNAMGTINGSQFKQIESNVKQLDTTLVATKGSANQLDRAFDTIDARAITVVDAQAVSLKEKLQSIIPTATEVKEALTRINNVNFSGVSEKIDGVKSRLTGLGSSSKTATNGFNQLNNGSRLAGAGLGFLRNAASMTVGMLGYDLFNSMMETTRASLNARSSIEAFASRLSMSSTDVVNFQKSLDDLQSTYKKIDMDVVGQQATDLAYRLGLSKDSLSELTETTAIFMDAMQRNGRSAEDSMLAMSDAMDGQFTRLKEIGIQQEDLMRNGWNGDLSDKESLLRAINSALKEQHYDELAKSVDTLDDAWQVLSITGSNLMESILLPLVPTIVTVVNGLTDMINFVKDNGWVQGVLLIGSLAVGFGLLAGMISVAAAAEGGLMTLMPGFITSLYGAASGFMAITVAGAPLWAIVAVVAAIAIAVYELGIAFGWWTDVGSMIDAIRAGVMRLWEAFINNPHVQEFIKSLGDAWNWLCDAMKPVIDWAKQTWEALFPPGTNFDIVRSIIDFFGALGDVLAWIVGAAKNAWNALGGFGGVLLALTGPVGLIVAALRMIVCILLGCSPGIVPALQRTWEVFSEIFNNILSFIGGIISPIVEAIRPLIDIFIEIVTFMVESFMPVWELLSSILTVIFNSVLMLINVFQQFLMGQITLPQMLGMIWNIIMTTFMTILTMIVNFVLMWAGQIISAAINAATGFVNGIISYISSLPGRFWDYLSQTTGNIISAGGQWVDNARQKAGEMVNGAATTVQELPGKIYDEFIKVPDRIREAIPQAIAAALNFGKDIINGVLNAMGIHSPGIAQNSIGEEFKGVVTKIKDTIKPAGEYARQVGEAIVDKFGEPKLSMDTEDLMPYQDLDANPLENVDMADIDLSSISGGLDSAMGMTDDTNTMIGESYNALATMMMTTLNNMVLQDQLAYGAIQTNDLSTFQNISTGLNLNLLSMSTNLRTQLNNMLMTHRAAMNNATNTTRQQLAQMLSETMKVTGEMRSAWAVMADSIISAAARIRNEATAYFDQLSSTIGTFYRKLQNPSQWAGGGSNGTPSTVRHTGRDPAVMHRLTRGVANTIRRDNQLPYTITATKAQQNRIIDPLTLEYMNKTSSSRLNVLDLLQSGICPNCVAGSWDGVVDPNVTHIKNTAREWQMRGPAIHTGVGDIDTGLSFKVSDFESGTPHISWGSFVRIATAIASAIPYDYYYNSDKYGSWQNAIAHGAWNCYDGASAMVALASACGYSGYVNCGLNWGSDGHCCAVINGYTFDTTALKQRGGWTAGPCNYSHPAPSAGGINIKIPNRGGIAPRTHSNPLEGLFDNNKDDASNVEEVKLILEHNVNVNVDGKTEDVDTDSLIKMLTEKISDKNVINKIADALIKRDKRIARMGGV